MVSKQIYALKFSEIGHRSKLQNIELNYNEYFVKKDSDWNKKSLKKINKV